MRRARRWELRRREVIISSPFHSHAQGAVNLTCDVMSSEFQAGRELLQHQL